MALLTNIDKDSYTKSGKGAATKFAQFLSYIPLLPAPIKFAVGMIDTVIESAQQLFRGKFLSAATVAAAGFVGSTVDSLTSSSEINGLKVGGWTWWGGNALSGIGTGVTLGTHARAATEALIGSVTGALGMKPEILRSYEAGIGTINRGVAQAGPGRFASNVSAERGENADAAYQRYMAGEGGVHVNELQSANGRSA